MEVFCVVMEILGKECFICSKLCICLLRNILALTSVGECESKQGNLQDAEVYFRKALRQQLCYAHALLGMAEISYVGLKTMQARAFLERFLSYHKPTSKVLALGFFSEQALGVDEKSAEYKSMLLMEFPLSDELNKISKRICQID